MIIIAIALILFLIVEPVNVSQEILDEIAESQMREQGLSEDEIDDILGRKTW